MRLIEFATLLVTFEEHMYETSSVRQVVPPEQCTREAAGCAHAPDRQLTASAPTRRFAQGRLL